jgi:radical SAM protein with 4Fe4S-binding SPASM domain
MLEKKEIVYTEEMIRHIDETIDKYLNTSDMNIIFRKEALQKYIHKVQMFKHCCALPFWGYISSKGDFYTCSVFIDDKRFTTGNIYVNNTDYIFFGEKRQQSIHYGKDGLIVKDECRLNCRMARINEFLEILEEKPAHVNFI